MKYFLLQIWILPLVRGILSLPEGNQLDFYHKNYRKSWQNHILDRRKFPSDFSSSKLIQKRHLDAEKISSVIKEAHNLLKNKSMRTINLAQPVIIQQKLCEESQHIPPADTFNKVVCQQVPGRIICQAGKVTFVINNGDHHMDNNVIERFVVMANQRYGEGDESFDVSVDDKETTLCPCYAEEITTTTREPDQLCTDEAPVVVECTLVSNEKLKMCNPFYDPSEKIYQCKAKKLGIKKRSIVHIAVHQNGTVSRVQDPILFRRRDRSKGELDRPELYETVLLENKKLKPRSLRENDLSNLYYHTLVPYVRNYSDCCTLKCGSYLCGLESTPCKITMLETFNHTMRPCRDASKNRTIHFETRNKTINTETKNKTCPAHICTEVITTNEAFHPSEKPTVLPTEPQNRPTNCFNCTNQTALHENKTLKPRSLRENDLSNLYYHTLVPYVRNYSDCCTLKCGSYLCGLESTPCKITMLETFNHTMRPCRHASKNRTIHFETRNKTEPLCICTEVTTNEAFFNSTKVAVNSKRRNRIRWDSGNIGFNRNSNVIRNRRQNFLLGKLKTTSYSSGLAQTPCNKKKTKALVQKSTNPYSFIVKALDGESNSKIPKMRSYRRHITLQSESKLPFKKNELLNVHNLLDHVVNQSEIKYGHIPSFGQSEQQSYFLTDKVKNNESNLRTNYSGPMNAKNAEPLLNDISLSIKNHIRRKRKLPSMQKLKHKKIKKLNNG